MGDKICIWHGFLVDEGTRRQIQAEPKASACIRRQVPIWAFIDQKAVPYAFYRTTTHMFNW